MASLIINFIAEGYVAIAMYRRCVHDCDIHNTYCTQGFFMPLNFHELFWIREIKFVKCYSYIGKNACVRENLNMDIQFLKNL